MHPYMTEKLVAAHRDELRRVATRNHYPTDESLGLLAEARTLGDTIAGARRTVGALLIRAGGRLGGVEAFPSLPTAG